MLFQIVYFPLRSQFISHYSLILSLSFTFHLEEKSKVLTKTSTTYSPVPITMVSCQFPNKPSCPHHELFVLPFLSAWNFLFPSLHMTFFLSFFRYLRELLSPSQYKTAPHLSVSFTHIFLHTTYHRLAHVISINIYM